MSCRVFVAFVEPLESAVEIGRPIGRGPTGWSPCWGQAGADREPALQAARRDRVQRALQRVADDTRAKPRAVGRRQVTGKAKVVTDEMSPRSPVLPLQVNLDELVLVAVLLGGGRADGVDVAAVQGADRLPQRRRRSAGRG